MASKATAERAAPRLGVILSIILHVGVIVAFFVSFSKQLTIPTESLPVVPIDLVTVGEETNITPTVKPEDNTPPPEPAEITPPAPEVAPPNFEIAPDVKPEAKQKPKPEEKFNIADIEKLLSKHKNTNAKVGARPIQGAGAQTAMTADLVTALFNQIRPCWNPPVYVKASELAVVQYEVRLTKDGHVLSMTPSGGMRDIDTSNMTLNNPGDQQRFASIAPLAAAQTAAKKAMSACAPYRLPPDRYSEWKDVIVTFDPRQLAPF